MGSLERGFGEGDTTAAPQINERCPYQKMVSTPAHAGAFYLPSLEQRVAVPGLDTADSFLHNFSFYASPHGAHRTRGPPEQNLPV